MPTKHPIGKTIYDEKKSWKGIIVSKGFRYSKALRRKKQCYKVKWDNGAVTQPFVTDVKYIGNDEYQEILEN